jgi:hypothetical protein
MSSGLICYMNWRPTDAWRPTESGDQSLKAKAKYVNHPATCISLYDALTDTVTPPTYRGCRMSSNIHASKREPEREPREDSVRTRHCIDTRRLSQGRLPSWVVLCMYLYGAHVPGVVSVWASSTICGVLATVTDGCTVTTTDGIQPVHGRPRRL